MSEKEETTLPALIDRARACLAAAKSSGQVLEAKHAAQAALHYAKLTGAANETHADCLRMIVRAKCRMADEVDASQAAGEVAKVGQPKKSKVENSDDTSPATLNDIGITKQELSDWRKTRDAIEEKGWDDAIEAPIAEALAEKRAPTNADINRHVRGTFGTGENEWYTPAEYIEAARQVLGTIDLDPASTVKANKTIKAKKIFTVEDDGLKKAWRGRVWLNPPYAQPAIANFVHKLVEEYLAERVTEAILLTHNYTDTAWFQEILGACVAVCFTRGRIKFVRDDGEIAAPTQGQAFTYFGQDVEQFFTVFSQFGVVMVRHDV